MTRCPETLGLGRSLRWLATSCCRQQRAPFSTPLPSHPITALPSNTLHCSNHEGNYIPRHRHCGWHRLRRRPQDAAEEGPVVQAAGKLYRVNPSAIKAATLCISH